MEFFVHYSNLEEEIFSKIKSHFENISEASKDDYPNSFYDVVAQYGDGGEAYGLGGLIIEKTVEKIISDELKGLSKKDYEEISRDYEGSFFERYYDYSTEEYLYNEDDLESEILSRFKAWIDDNFNLDDLLYELNGEDDYYDEDADD